MNVLERLVADELTRVPEGPAADELRRRARVRRARRVGAVAMVAIVFAVLAIAAMLQSPDSRHVQVSQPTPTVPLATTAEFPPLAKIIASLTGTVERNADPKAVVANPTSAEIVATTDTRAFTEWGGTHDDKLVYVAQVTGDLVCGQCRGIHRAGAKPMTGHALQLYFDSDGKVTDFGFGGQPKDLAKLGTVYRLPLP